MGDRNPEPLADIMAWPPTLDLELVGLRQAELIPPSSPIFAISPQPQGHWVLAGSTTRSTRGRCAGRWPRLRFGLRGASPRARCIAASAFSCAAASTPWANSASSKGRLNWSGDSFSERLPNVSRCDVRRISSSLRLASCDSASAASTSARRAFRRAFSRARTVASMVRSES